MAEFFVFPEGHLQSSTDLKTLGSFVHRSDKRCVRVASSAELPGPATFEVHLDDRHFVKAIGIDNAQNQLSRYMIDKLRKSEVFEVVCIVFQET